MKRFSTLLLLLAGAASQAQTPAEPSGAETHCLLTPVPAATRAAQATLVVEGEVVSSQGFRGAGGRIFTEHRVRIYKVLKGAAPGTELTVLTEGGTVGLDQQVLTNTLQLTVGEQGILFLQASTQQAPSGPAWEAYASQQGFVRYDLTSATAADPFRTYPQLNAGLYAAVAATAPPQEVQPNPALTAALARRRMAVAAKGTAPVISTLSPQVLTAGTGAVLTINGSGFGAARGTVEFRNANDGGNTYTRVQDADYLTWSDTQIRVRVPSNSATGDPAGTGPVRVTTTGQLGALSAVPVTVVYAATNVQDSRTNQRVVAGHIDQNNAGGLTFRFESNLTSNAAASAAFQRALASWRCQSGINWDVAAAPRTGRGPAEDNENAVGFDSGGELPAGVLGRTTSYYRGCYQPDGTVRFYVQEVDMQLDDATAWQFGPANPVAGQLDFESVVLHELGHAQQLSHLILPSAVMHYAIARGQRSRVLAQTSDIAGGRFVLRSRSFVPGACGPVPMLPAPLVGQSALVSGSAGTTVQWTTRAECFVQEFVVERAPSDTTAGWHRVGQVTAGAAAGQYRLVDPRPLPGLSYYRLRVRRPDGSLDSARPVLVTDDATLAADGLRFFPNPLTDADQLRLEYLGSNAGTLTLRFYDAIGRYLGGTLLDYQQGVNVLSLTPPGELRAGWYIVRWEDTDNRNGRARLIRAR